MILVPMFDQDMVMHWAAVETTEVHSFEQSLPLSTQAELAETTLCNILIGDGKMLMAEAGRPFNYECQTCQTQLLAHA